MSTLSIRRTATETPTGRLGMWWFLGSEILIFGGLVTTYVLLRMRHPEWSAEAAHTMTAAGAINTMVLLTSSLTAILAHEAAAKGDFAKSSRFLFFTVGGGLVFLCIKAFEYSHEIHAGYTPVTGLFWSFYYILTGLHALHVIGGMTAIAVVAWKTPSQKSPEWVENVGLYWHLVDVIWIFLFPLLYLAS